MQARRDSARNLPLHREDVPGIPFKGLTPALIPSARVDEARGDPHAAARSADAPLDEPRGAEGARDLLHVHRRTAETERGRARDDFHAGDARDRVEDFLADPLAKGTLGALFAHVGEGEHRQHFFGSRLAHRARKPVPASRHRLDRVIAQLLAQLEGELGEVALLDHHVGPQGFDERAARHDAPRVLDEECEQLHCLGHQRNALAAPQKDTLRDV